jgi:hypothetical protein
MKTFNEINSTIAKLGFNYQMLPDVMALKTATFHLVLRQHTWKVSDNLYIDADNANWNKTTFVNSTQTCASFVTMIMGISALGILGAGMKIRNVNVKSLRYTFAQIGIFFATKDPKVMRKELKQFYEYVKIEWRDCNTIQDRIEKIADLHYKGLLNA